MSALVAVLASALAQDVQGMPPLPAQPPIGGPIWTVVVPGALLLFAAWATWLLYKHFANEE